jgi:hypothetical protein
MIRQLTDIEKEVSRKGIERLDRETRWMEFELKYTQLMLEEGLQVNLEKQTEKFRDAIALTKEQIRQNKETIKAMEDQIVNGVECTDPNVTLQPIGDTQETVYVADLPKEE